jgi:hypothetical protein
MSDEITANASTDTGSIEGVTSAPAQTAASEPVQATQTEQTPPRRRSVRDHMEAHDRAVAAGKASGEARKQAAEVVKEEPAKEAPPKAETPPAPAEAKKEPTPDKPQSGAKFLPPDRWPAARKELFAKQPPEVQEAWLAQHKEFESGFTKKSQDLSERAKIADGVRGLFTDEHRQAMQRVGVQNEVGAVQYLLAQHDFYKRDPRGYVAAVMRNAGIDPRIYIQGATETPEQQGQQPEQQQQLPPVHPALLQEIGTLRETLQNLSAREQERVAQQVEATIAAFESAKDDSGSLAHPHFERVADTMIELVKSDPRLRGMPDGSEKLQRAYDLAIWDDAELRQEIIDAETQRRIAAHQALQPQTPPAPTPPAPPVQASAPAPVQTQQPQVKAPTSIKPKAGIPDASPGRSTGRRTLRQVMQEYDRANGIT